MAEVYAMCVVAQVDSIGMVWELCRVVRVEGQVNVGDVGVMVTPS